MIDKIDYDQYNIITTLSADSPRDPCNPSPCGSNAQCNNGLCTCLSEYSGDPYSGCRPECVVNPDCPRNRACIRNKCVDPCIGTCGLNAECVVVNHLPMCSCPRNMSGNAFVSCSSIGLFLENFYCKKFYKIDLKLLLIKLILEISLGVQDTEPCNPSPCGPNSHCRKSNGQAVCSCIPGYNGAPPSCRPECVVNSDCARNRACVNLKCIDPCIGSCGFAALCAVINHNPVCSCPLRYTGDPFKQCYMQRKIYNLKY